MKMKMLHKYIIAFGLTLFLSVLIPVFADNTVNAQAAETGKDNSDTYRLCFDSVTLPKGATRTLKVYNAGEAKIYFKSNDDEIASVNSDGKISANKVGETAITVTIKDGSDPKSLNCDVTVGPAAVSVKWTKSIVFMSIDSVDALKVLLKPSNTVEDAKFTSMNSSVVSITPGGRISAKNYGFAELRAYIDATNADGSQKYDSCSVIVTSEANVPKLEKYFSDHPELYSIPEEDLRAVLSKFFNEVYDPSTSLIGSLNRYLNNYFDFK